MLATQNILVTGAGGMLGARLLPQLNLVYQKSKVFPVFHGHKSEVFDNSAIGDITDTDFRRRVIELAEPDLIINLAALTDVERCEREPEQAARTNTKLVVELCRSAPNAKFVQLSTDYVFDGSTGSYSPGDTPAPISVYGKTKLESESPALSAPEGLVIRTAGTFDWLNQKNLFRFFVSALSQKKKIKALSDCIYSPIWADDLARGIIGLLKQRSSDVVHYAGPAAVSRFEFAQMIADEFELNKKHIAPTTQTEFNWQAKRPIDSSLESSSGYDAAKVKPKSLAITLAIIRKQMA